MKHRLHLLLSLAFAVASATAAQAASLSTTKQSVLKKLNASLHCFCGPGNNISVNEKQSIAQCSCSPGSAEYQRLQSELQKQPDDQASLDDFLYTSLLALAEKYGNTVLRHDRQKSWTNFMTIMSHLKCMCGDCPYRPMHVCACGFADRWRRLMWLQFTEGKTERWITAFYAKKIRSPYDGVRADPNKTLSWVVPLIAAGMVLIILVLLILRWSSRRRATESATPAPTANIDDAMQQKLKDALRQREQDRGN